MIIEFSNAIEPKNHSTLAMAIVISASALFFIPTTLIVLGYYSSQPTGSLISPVPQTTLSQTTPSPTKATENPNLPIIAGPNDSSSSAQADVAPVAGSNITDKTTSISAGETIVVVKDPEVAETSQIYLSPRVGDKSIFSLKSKTLGEFTIEANSPSDVLRYIDYHIVNP